MKLKLKLLRTVRRSRASTLPIESVVRNNELPLQKPADATQMFYPKAARIARNDGTLSTSLKILVSPEDNAELRHPSITSSGFADARGMASANLV